MKTHQNVDIMKGHSSYVSSFALNGNNTLYSGSFDCTIQVWDIKTRKVVTTVLKENTAGKHTSGHNLPVTSIYWTGDKLVSASQDMTVKVWSKDLVCKFTLMGHTDWVLSVTVINKKIFSGSRDNTIKVWDIESGQSLATLNNHSNVVYTLANNGKLLFSGSMDKSIKVWDTNNYQCLHSLYGHTNNVYTIIPAHGNTIFSASWDKLIKIWQ